MDITDRKRLEVQMKEDQLQLIHANRMGELGKMAGSIAHEINNPIQAIQLNAERLVALGESNELSSESVNKSAFTIMRISERITKIVKSLKQFSRDGINDPFEMGSTHTIIHDTLDLCTSRIQKRGVELIFPTPETELFIECRPSEIGQALLILLNNSSDAIQDLPSPWIRIDVVDNKKTFLIKVTDSGQGIPENIRDKVMNPFFTTKPIGQGTGLGLSIAKNVIERHKGRLYIDDESPNTCFCIELPKVQSAEHKISA